MKILRYFLTLLDGLSALTNAALLMGSNQESVSGRSYRESVYEGKSHWKPLKLIIDMIFYLFEKDHCRKSYYNDLKRAEQYRERHHEYIRAGRTQTPNSN